MHSVKQSEQPHVALYATVKNPERSTSRITFTPLLKIKIPQEQEVKGGAYLNRCVYMSRFHM